MKSGQEQHKTVDNIMKKTLLALAIPALLASGAANAVNIYDNNGTKLDFTGSLRMMLEYKDNRVSGDHDVKLVDQSSRFGFKINHDLGNGLTGFAALEYGNDTQAYESDFKLKNRLGYGGLALADVGDISFGRVLSPFDDVAMSDYTYEYGGVLNFDGFAPRYANDNFIGRVSHTVRVMSADFNGFSAGGTYTLQNEATSVETDTKKHINNAYTAAVFYDTSVGLKINAGYGHADLNNDKVATVTGFATERSEDIWGTSVEYNIDAFTIAADFGQTRKRESGISTQKKDLYGLGTKYNYGMGNVYAGFYYKDGNKATNNASNRLTTVGTDYHFTKSFRVWTEYANVRYKEDQVDTKKENKVAVGLRVYF